MPSDYTPSYMRWYNSAEGSKVASADVGSYEQIPYGGQRSGEVHAQGKPPHQRFGQWQWGLACSKTSRTIMIDIDHPEEWHDSQAYVELGEISECATSYREDGQRFHIWVVVPAELLHLWPRQGQTAFGDIKSNGFSYHEGVHYSGMRYIASANPVVTADEKLMRAMTEDRVSRDEGTATGAVAGKWDAEGYQITSDNQLTADIMSMVLEGQSEEQILARLDVILQPLSDPWTPAQIESKIRSAERKAAEREQRYQDFWGSFHPEGWAGLLRDTQRAAAIAASSTPVLPAQRVQPVLLAAVPEPDYSQLQGGTDSHVSNQMLGYMAPAGYAHANDTDAWFEKKGTAWARLPKSPTRTFVYYVGGKLPFPKDDNWDGSEAPKLDTDPELKAKKLWMKLNNQRTAASLASCMDAGAPLFKSISPVDEAEMDANPLVFWAGGLPYSLRTLEPVGDPSLPHLLEAGYAPAVGETRLWDQLNEAQFPADEMREYALNIFASILPGGANKLLPNFKSDGNMGKTTRLKLLVDLFGTYAVQLPVQLLGNYSGHDEMYLRLKGKRLAYLDETPPSSKVANEKLKHLSGGGELTGRAINGRTPITFSMQHTLILAGNDDLPLNDPNVQRRVRYLPITGTLEDIKAVSVQIWDHGEVSAAWRAEAPAVLWKLMVRAQAILGNPDLCAMPPGALDHFATAIIEQDTVSEFVADCCVGDGETSASSLHEEYVAWCQRHNVREILNSTRFGRRLTEMGHEARRISAGNVRPLKVKPYSGFVR